MKRIAILQSNYIPWKGYFDLINSVDLFIVYDHVQFTKNDWRNRNQIKTQSGLLWLTIPVRTAKNLTQSIRSTRVSDSRWASQHRKSLDTYLGKARHYQRIRTILHELFDECEKFEFLHDINIAFLIKFCNLLDIRTIVKTDSEYQITESSPTSKLIEICQQAQADTYVTGPSALAYLDLGSLKSAGLNLEVIDYDSYSEYQQLHGAFRHQVSVIDLLANTGERAKSHLLGRTVRINI